MFGRILLFTALLCGYLFGSAQTKLSVTISNPSEVHLCLLSDYIEIEVRNISTATVTGIECQLEMPSGMTYEPGSLSSTGATEKNVTNLSKPVFTVTDLNLAQAALLKVKVNTSCNISSFLNNGGLAIVKSTTLYSGGSVFKNSSPLNVKQPSLQIQSITNQLYTADVNEVFIRQITLKNSGTGKVGSLMFFRTYGSGVQLLGTSLNITGTSGDTSFSQIDSALLTQQGNGDQYLNLNETIVISDTIKVLNCNDLSAKYATFFGCNNQVCQFKISSANVSISPVNPNLVFTPSTKTSNCTGSDVAHEQQLIIYNAGTDTARAIDLHVFQSSNTGFTSNILSQIDTGSFLLAKGLSGAKTSVVPYQVNTTNNSGFYSCLGSNPIGDTYLKLQDLGPGDSLVLTWDMYTCNPTLCSGNVIYNQRWKFDARYKNQCETELKQNERWGFGGKNQYLRVSKFGPTDILAGQVRQLEYTITQGYFMTPRSTSQFQLEMILPAGVTHSASGSDLYFTHPNGTSWSPSYFTQSGDTITAYFNGVPTVTLARSELLINLVGDCSNSSSNGDKTYKVNWRFNPDTTCSSNVHIPVYCDTDIIRVHCDNSCAAGMHFNGFETERITYGQPDNNNDGVADATGTLDLDKIKKHRIMYGDTLLSVFKGRVHNGGTSATSNWRNGAASSTIDLGYYLSVAEVRVKIYRGGNLLFNCNNVSYTSSAAGWSKTFTFDISYNNLVNSGCALYSTFAYLTVDSVEVEVKYVVDKNPGNSVRDINFSNSFYLSPNANPSASQKYQCDEFSSKLSIVGYYYTNYGKNTITSTGCNTIAANQNFYLSIGNCCSNYGGGNIFPYEYRPWARLKEIIVKKPAGFDVLNNRLIQYRTAGTGATATERIDTIFPTSSSPTELKFSADSFYAQGGELNVSDDGFHGTYTAYLRPNCQAIEGYNNVEYGFIFQNLGALGTGQDTVFTTTQNDVIEYFPPKIDITLKTNNINADKDTVVWDLKLSNQAQNSDANFFWFTNEASNNANIVQVIDLATGQAIVQQNDLFLIGDVNRSSQADYRIVATYSDCTPDSIALQYGYDCNGYPATSDSFPCEKQEVMLYYNPINTLLETTIIDTLAEVDLCAKRPYTVTIRNTGSPNVFDLYLDIITRPGMIIGDTAWLFIDGRNDSILVSTPTYIGSSTFRWMLSDADSLLDENGLNGVTQNSGYLMQLRFTLKTNCDFTSATSFLMRPGGYLKCGDPVNSRFDVSNEYNIKGISKPYFATVNLQMKSLDVCNYEDSTRIRFINLGPDTTGLTDQIILTLPDGLTVDTNYIDNSHNAPNQRPAFEVINGENTYKWNIPSGIVAGDSSVLRVKTLVNANALECGIKQIYCQSVISQSVLCVEDSTYCDINVATSSVLRSDTVKKNIFALEFNGATSVPLGTNDAVSLSYTIENYGTDKAANDTTLCSIFYDANGNGTVDSGDVWVASDTVLPAILSGASLSRLFNFEVASNYTCNLLLQVGDSNCICSQTTVYIPTVQLLNAGPDTTACAATPFEIGTAGSAANTYRWNNAQWLNRDDTSSTLFTGVNYSNADSTIRMILTTDKGACSSSDTVLITLYPQMQMNMVDSVKLCKGDKIIIGSLVTGGVGRLKQYQWNPTDSLERPTSVKTFAYPSTSTMYTVMVTDDEGCTLSDSTYVKVIERPDARMTIQDSCASTAFQFTNASAYYGTAMDSIHWTIGTVEESLFENPSFILDSAHTLTVKLFTSNDIGCWDTASQRLTVHPNPQPQIRSENGCEGDTVSLWATVASDSVDFVWDIENTSYAVDTLSYVLPYGNSEARVNLSVTSKTGCIGSARDTLAVYTKPNASLSVQDVCLGDSSNFAMSLVAGNIDSLNTAVWDLGDGSTRSGTAFSHKYSASGTYNIAVLVASNRGCADTANTSTAVHAQPNALLTATDACLGTPNTVASSYGTSQPAIALIQWDTGSGYFTGDSILTTQPGAIGRYNVSQRIETAFGCADTASAAYWVYHTETPVLIVDGNCVNEEITLRSQPQSIDSVQSIAWEIEGNPYNQADVNYTFASAGVYSIVQTVTTLNGCQTSDTFNVTIDPAPVASINYDKICSDNEVDFSSNSSTACAWDLGDGSSQNACNFKHYYAAKGSYDVTLIVTNSFGCKDTTQETIIIDNLVVPDFKIRDACEEEVQWVVHTTSGNGPQIVRATFDMGNGDVINELDSFQYAYATAGVYTVSLEVETASGCTYDSAKQVEIYPLPFAGFSIDPEEADIFSDDITITDESLGADSVAYRLSNGVVYTARDFDHHFADSGSYTIEQWVTTQFGCMDSLTRSLYVSYAYKLFIPNSFTPNDDQYNNEFKPVGLGMKAFELQIFNRWGEKLFESAYPNEAWDGEEALPGYYLYILTVTDFRNNRYNYSGVVYLVR